MTLTGLADATGIALSTMYRWKESLPHHRTSKQIAEVLRVSEAWLREGLGEMESEGVLREESVQYRVEPLAGRGSKTGINPQPKTSAELLNMCHLVLNSVADSGTPEELDQGILAMTYALNQLKRARLAELK